tara:strand:- start:43270 stop:44547 length:1278 start_codon:yes stop_codon:yes gene_type:complete
MKKLKLLLCLTIFSFTISVKAQYLETQPNGELWYDTDGNVIDAHARSYIQVGDTFYMFGEKREGPSDNQFRAFHCYSSTDLSNWTFRNTVLTAADIGIQTVGTRVDVLFNEQSQQYVMYFKSKNNERKYGLATCSTVDGDYDFKGRFYPTSGDFGDGTLWKEPDGTAYLVYSCLMPTGSTGNNIRHLRIDRLSSDYLTVESNIWDRPADETNNLTKREAPIIFNKDGRYYIITSRTSGWRSNQATYIHATSLAGPWTEQQNIGDALTYDSQGSSMLTITGTEGTSYFYSGDRWNGNNLQDSRYMFLPIQFDANGVDIFMDYYDTFFIDTTKGLWSTNVLSVNKISQTRDNFKLYPNPSSSVVHISGFSQDSHTIDILDLQGRNYNSIKVSNQKEIKLPVNNLPAGIYFIKIQGSKIHKTLKFIRK